MKHFLDYLFNWKKYPASVFFLVAPLALIAFGSMFALAFLHLKWSGNPWYLVIFMAAMSLFVAALYPIRKQLLAALRENSQSNT